jgi:hypothetical protein
MPEPTPIRDMRFEALFQRWNLTFEFVPDLHLTDDLKVLDEAQVRDLANIGPTPRVDEYAMQMKAGAPFPPIVVASQLRDSANVMIDGNTRARAARKLHREIFPAYVVSPIPDVNFAKVLAGALNQLGGARLEQAEARKTALTAMDMGYSDDQIAREIGYSAESVRRWRRDQQLEDRVERLGLGEAVKKITKTQRNALAAIDHDVPFAEAVTLAADIKADPQDFKELIEEVKQAPSDEGATAIIAKAREDWQPIGPPPQKVYRNKVASQARMHIGGLLKIDDPAAVYDPTKSDEDLQKWRELRDVVDRVLAVFEQQLPTGDVA